MALDTAPIPRRKHLMAATLETTTNTPASLAGTGVFHSFNARMDFTDGGDPREEQNTSDPIRQGLGDESAESTFQTELYGNESSDLSVLLKGCGLTLSTATYTPQDSPNQSITLGLYQGGSRLKTMSGAMGNGVFTFRNGKAPRIDWRFLGVPQRPSNTSMLTPTFDSTIAPRIVTTFTIASTTYFVNEVVFDMGNEVDMREDITGVNTDSDPTGYRSAMILHRRAIVRVAPEALPLTTKDWNAVRRDPGTAVALSIVVGNAADNTFTLAVPYMQLPNFPRDGDRRNMLTDELEFVCNAGPAGEAAYTMAFTDPS